MSQGKVDFQMLNFLVLRPYPWNHIDFTNVYMSDFSYSYPTAVTCNILSIPSTLNSEYGLLSSATPCSFGQDAFIMIDLDTERHVKVVSILRPEENTLLTASVLT